MKTYFLWGFLIDGYIVLTRGETREQAQKWATRNITDNTTVGILDNLPINAAELYTINHPFNWLYKAPLWVEREEIEKKRAKNRKILSPEERKNLKIAFNKVIEAINKKENLSLEKT